MDRIEAAVGRVLRRLPLGRRIAPMQTRLASFGEQGMQGAANLLVNVILARSLGHEGFAAIGVMLGVHYFVHGIHRSAVVFAYILNADEEGGEAHRRWWWFNLLSMAAAAALLAATATVASLAAGAKAHWFVTGLALAVPVTPSLLFYEFGRRMLYQQRRASTAALASAVYLVLNLGVASIVAATGATPAVGALAWVAAGLGGGAVATLANPPGRPQLAAAWRMWWHHRSFAFWQALTTLPYSVYNSSVVVLVGLFGGATATAAFTAARTLTNPAISMVAAVDSLDKPRAARALASDGLPGLRRSVGRTRRLLAILCGTYLAALIVTAPWTLRLAFGDAYADQVTEIRLLAVAFFLICMNQPSETLLIVLRQSKLLLATRLIAAAVAVASLALAQPYGLMGSVVALLVTHLINVVDLRGAEAIGARRWRSRSEPAPAVATLRQARA